jgi:hypothetical protein
MTNDIQNTPEFQPWGKTPRWSGIAMTATEKLDGTNALVHVTDDGRVLAGSRNRWLTPGKTSDNYGFAAWVTENAVELAKLGAGWHYGEWWGQGVGRGYGVEGRTFSLFDTRRFGAHNPNTPSCCSVVPKLYEGLLVDPMSVLAPLMASGSVAAPGFMRPEGIIILLHQTGQRFKLLAEKHNEPKWVRGESSPCE